ncbi:MAG: hypothetical protein HQL11_05595, partial [Candidatus Omnitrophica bacterium]|nr:hypothetical protein [Candidatus Omnitrophota bacterium]
MAERSIRSVLLVSFSNIGDAVLSLPVLKALSERFPEARIDVVAGPRAAMVFEGDSRIRELLIYEKRCGWKKRLEFLNRIRKRRYDRVVDLRYSLFGFLGKRRARWWAPRIADRRDAHLAALTPLG